jgi:dTDP-4-amino-4,6-dideoxygalactose transaminase
MLGHRYETVNQSWGWRELNKACRSSNDCSLDGFSKDIALLLGGRADQVALFASARAGLLTLLCSLQKKNKKTVMLCALNCPVVSDAVITSGMQPLYYDLADRTGELDCRAIAAQAPDDCGIVIIPHLYGVPAASKRDIACFREKKIIVIEDCAHALNATIEGDAVGTLGDYSIFSFNHDKPISLGGGGMVWSNTSLPAELATESKQSVITVIKEHRELNWFRVFLAVRRVCGVIHPKIGMKIQKLYNHFTELLGVSDAGSGFPVSGFGRLRAQLGTDVLECYEAVKIARNNTAAKLISLLKMPIWEGVAGTASPAWLRLRVVLPSQKDADQCVSLFRKHGLRVGRFNWPDLPPEVEESDFPNAFLWAKCGVDVPIHNALSEADVEILASELNALL